MNRADKLDPEEIPILVISLDRRPDRMAKFMEYATAAHIDPSRIVRLSAVDATTFDAIHHPSVSLLTAHNIKNKVRRAHYEIDRAGAVGASLSHFKAWEYLQNSRSEALIVFEDDAPIPVDFNERLEKIVSELPPSWDMVTFYNTSFAGGIMGCSVKEGDEQRKPWQSCNSQMGAHAYMVSRRGAQRLLARAYPIELHVDAYVAFMARLGYIDMIWNPDLQIVPNFDDSDINHGGNDILNVPTNMEKNGIVALDMASLFGIIAMVAVVGGIVTLALVKTK
jgi:GR25 family glycosyltransferase involved in LPS biosynthesis